MYCNSLHFVFWDTNILLSSSVCLQSIFPCSLHPDTPLSLLYLKHMA